MGKTILWIAAITMICLIVYDVKYNVHQAQKETKRLEAQLIDERKRLHMVELEWAYLSRPERIAALANAHLTLEPIAPGQILTHEMIALPGNTSVTPISASVQP